MKIPDELKFRFNRNKESKYLEPDEIDLLRSVGVLAENWFAVCYTKNSMPMALFQDENHAKAYRDQFTITSIIEPWPMIIKDYRV